MECLNIVSSDGRHYDYVQLGNIEDCLTGMTKKYFTTSTAWVYSYSFK